MKADDLWALNTEDFNKWRAENDMLKRFEEFKAKLPLFEEWLTEFGFTIEFLISINEPGKFFSEDNDKFVIKYKDSDGYFFIPILKSRFEKDIRANLIKTAASYTKFSPYFHWIKRRIKKDKSLRNKYKDKNAHYSFKTFSAVPSHLKLGPRKFPEGYILTGPNYDFANLDFFEIDGDYHGNTQIDIHYSSFKNCTISNARLAFITFYECNIENLTIINSHLQGINFYRGQIIRLSFQNSGINSMMLEQSLVYGLSFENTRLKDFEYIPTEDDSLGMGKQDDYETIEENYKIIRMAYQDFGKRNEISETYYMERVYEQKKLISGILALPYYKMFSWSWRVRFYNWIKTLPKIIGNFLSASIWGYGERPARVFGISMLLIIMYSLAYYFSPICLLHENFINSLYLSIITFTTLGYGDITPENNDIYKIIVGTEALFGAFLIGLFVAAYANKSRY